jgi:predicted RNase H-like HicB family nuclease
LRSESGAITTFSRENTSRKSSTFNRRDRWPKPIKSGKSEASSFNTTLQENPMTPDPRYEIILYWSESDRAFIAEVPELAGCAADGATYQEALLAAEVVIREWIETARELGRPIPQPKGRLMFA